MTDQHQPQNWYTGPYNKQMERLIRDGGTPFSIADLIRKRINVQGEDNDIKGLWWNNPFNSDDGIAYHPNGNIKIVLNAHPLKQIVPESTLWRNGLILPDGIYETLGEVELRKDEIERYTSLNDQSKEQLQSNIIWVVLARGDHLLRDALGLFYMNINIDPHPKFPKKGASPIIKPLSIEIVDRGSGLYNGSLTDPAGCLVGKFTPNDRLETRL